MNSRLVITRTVIDGVVVLRLTGAVDLLGTTTLLRAVSDEASAGAPASIVCDLSDLSDLPGAPRQLLTVFPAAQRRMGRWPRQEMHLVAVPLLMTRQFARLRIDRFVTMHATLDRALTAIHAGHQSVFRHLELPPAPDSPARARRCLTTLDRGLSDPWQERAPLVIGELAANAVHHARTPFTVDLALRPSELLIGVTDASRQEPILRPLRSAAEFGRGIQLVAALSDAWGVRLVHDDGKTVWARLARVAG